MEKAKSPRLADPDASAFFVGGHAALDFLNSIAGDEPIEWLGHGDGFIAWLRQSKLVPQDALDTLASKAGPGEADAVAGQARALREWFRGFVHKYRGQTL